MKFLACTLLAALGLGTTAQAAETPLFRDDFSAASSWSAPEASTTVTLANGKLRYANAAAEYGSEIVRVIRMPAAAAYRLSFRVAEISHEGDQTYFGVGLRAPDGDQVGFVLAPEGQAKINYWHDGKWAPAALNWTQVPSMKRGAGAVNEVTVERQAGRFYLSVNGVLVGASDIVDMMPSHVVIFGNEKVAAEFDDVSVVQTGIDSRIARMLLMAPVPGQAVLKQDDFNRSLKEKVRASAMRKDDNWVVGSNRDRNVGIDFDRGLYYLDKKSEGDTWIYAGDVTDPRPWAGWSLGARVAYTRVSDNGCGGVVAIGKPKKEDMVEALLVACFRPDSNTAQLWHHAQDGSGWKALVDVSTEALRPGMNDVRLVFNNNRVLLFINGEYQGDAPQPSDFEFLGMGVYVDTQVGIEVDDFDAREI